MWGLNIHVFCDVNVLVDHVRSLDVCPQPDEWPTLPPRHAAVPAATYLLAACRDSTPAAGVHLWTSEHVLDNVYTTLVGDSGWTEERASDYTMMIERLVTSSGGRNVGLAERTIHDSTDHEDNVMLDGAFADDLIGVIVSGDAKDVLVLAMDGLFHGKALMSPDVFVARLDGAARAAKAKHR